VNTSGEAIPARIFAAGRRWLARARERLGPYMFALPASAALGAFVVHRILERAGRAALPLDDAFIHLQYARRLAEGGFFSYVAGEGYTTGATSLLWPMALAPFHLLGLRGLSLIWAAWLLGTVAHAALAVEVARLARRLAGRTAAAGAMVMSLCFGAFAWFAWSGMETVPFTWILMRTTRASAAFCEPERSDPSRLRPVHAAEVAALGFLAPLVRPEGMIASLVAAAALLLRPAGGSRMRRLYALSPLAGTLVVPALHFALAGHATSATAMVKWLPANPAYDRDAAWSFMLANGRQLWGSVLDGGEWTQIFLPEGWIWATALGAIALVARGARARLPYHVAFVLVVALSVLVPCTYLSFLWNRVRYVWPFLGAHFVLLACLAREVGGLARRFGAKSVPVSPLLVGLFAGALATRLPWSLTDLATSAHAIDRQQVTLGLWAAEHLPADAFVGVNDTGAITYLGGRRTFDVVGLTTEGEARYWASGPGSRFEHYESLPPARRPTHFIVYPQWMALPAVLGEELERATVTDQSILGGPTMVVYEARWDLLGSGSQPRALIPRGTLADEIDVADLESEAAHGYALEGSTDLDNVALLAGPPQGDGARAENESASVADGGRLRRALDKFTARLVPLRPATLVMRLSAEAPVTLAVRAGGQEVGTVDLPAGAWIERTVAIPAERADERTALEVASRSAGRFNAFHYWVYQ
jgi:hypothetical protein